MKKKEKRLILILVAITVIVCVIALVVNSNKGKKPEEEMNEPKEEFVNVLEDGTRLNTSTKLQETKTFDGLEISKFQLTEKDNVTLLLGTITNKGTDTRGGYPVTITVLDKQGQEIIKVGAFLGELKPGENTQLSTSATFDYANAYDFKVEKKQM